MTRWEHLENYIAATGGAPFTSIDLVTDLGITRAEASAMVQAHLAAQRGVRSQTTYVIYRSGRTSSAIWFAGDRSLDVRSLGQQYLDDMRTRVASALEPDLIRMGLSNPRATRVTAAIANAVAASLQLLEATLP